MYKIAGHDFLANNFSVQTYFSVVALQCAVAMLWVPHENALWLPGELLSSGGSFNLYKTALGDIKVDANKSLERILDEDVLTGVDDICLLSTIDDASVLHSLRTRYTRDEIYTYISSILVAVNPFKSIDIYSSSFIEKYRSAQDVYSLPPHIFGVSAVAFMRLSSHQLCQSVLVSGESGAGKTESTKLMLLYVSEVLRSETDLADKLLRLNPLLEAFGNAKTVRNNNSSRFGKWIELDVDPATMGLAGASVTDYLLEVTRVCAQGPGDRNYHVFYQLCTKNSRDAFPTLKLKEATEFVYLSGNPISVSGINDADDLLEVRQALTSMNFTRDEEESIFRIVAGILHIGNLDFEESNVEASKIKNRDVLCTAAEVLQCNAELLEKCVLFKRRVTGREVFESPNDPQKARSARDAVAKFLYSRLFGLIIQRCNAALGAELGSTQARALFFGVLDIAGFEVFETNMLEQLFINFSNEKLQQFFNNTVFKQELAEYMAEGVPITEINYKDNAAVLELIEGTMGLLPMLDDATTGVRQNDEQYTAAVIKQHGPHGKKSPHLIIPKIVKDEPLSFGVRHYAGEVKYTALQFLEKNVSTAAPEVVELVAGSESAFLHAIAADSEAAAAKVKSTAKKVRTVGGNFRASLNDLMLKLNKSEPNFIRCIKPNHDKRAGKIDGPLVMEQLRLSGVMETIKIRKAGFLMRPLCIDFLKRYLVLIPNESRKHILATTGSKKPFHPTLGMDVVRATHLLVEALPESIGSPVDQAEYCVGKTKMFMKAELYRRFEQCRRKAMLKPATIIESIWRGHRTRIVMREVMEINNALRRCAGEAGDEDLARVMGTSALRTHVRRATNFEGSVESMGLLIERALKLPIRLPRLPQYMKAHARVVAEAKLVRQISNANSSLDLAFMEAFHARAVGYGIQGPLVDSLNERCDELRKELPLRRALQNCAYCDGVGDAQQIITLVRDSGLAGSERWLLPDGPSCWLAATTRLQELEQEQQAKSRAIEAVGVQMRDLMHSTDVTTMQALIAQSTAYDMTGDLVESFKRQCDLVQRHMKVRKMLQMSLSFTGLEAVQAVLTQACQEKLDYPDTWVIRDGPKLFARASRWALELDQQQKSSRRLASSKRRIEDELFGADPETADLFRSNREPQVSCLRSSLDIPVVQLALGDDITKRLREYCDAVLPQMPYVRAMQACIVSESLEGIEKCIHEFTGLGLDRPEKWQTQLGRNLIARLFSTRDELRQERQAQIATRVSLAKRMEALQNSFEIPVMQGVIARASSLDIDPFTHSTSEVGDQPCPEDEILRSYPKLLSSLRDRCISLRKQRPIRQELQRIACSIHSDEAKQTLAKATANGLHVESEWLFPDGPQLYHAAVDRVQQLEELRKRLESAVSSFDSIELQACIREADECGMEPEFYQEALNLFASLQNRDYVEDQVVNLLAAPLDDLSSRKLKNLLDLVDDPDHFDTCSIMDQLSFFGLVENGCHEKEKDSVTGFVVRPKHGEFLQRYRFIVPNGKRGPIDVAIKTGKAAPAVTFMLEILPEFVDGLAEARIAVGKAKVFITPEQYCLLEASRREAIGKIVAKSQAAWRGYRTRAKLRPAILETLKIDKELLDLCEGLDTRGSIEEDLKHMDSLLERAVKLQLKPPSLYQYVQARGQLVERAELARHIESLRASLDVAALHAAIARGKRYDMDVAGLVSHLQKLQSQLKHRRLLRSCVASGNFEDLKSRIANARAAGLDRVEEWLLPNGIDSWSNATSKLEELEAEKASRERIKLDLDIRVKDALSSVDVLTIRALLKEAEEIACVSTETEDFLGRPKADVRPRSKSCEAVFPTICELRERCDILEEQQPHYAALRSCLALEEPEVVSKIIEQAEDAGLADTSNCLFPDGPTLYLRATSWFLHMANEHQISTEFVRDIQAQAQEMSLSLDTHSMRTYLNYVGQSNVKPELLNAVQERLGIVERQLSICAVLRDCSAKEEHLMKADDACRQAGLTGDPASWLVPDGARLAARVSSLRVLSQDVTNVPQTLQTEEKAMVDMLMPCIGSESLSEVENVVTKVRDAGYDKLSKWTNSAGHSLYMLAASRLEQLEEQQEEVELCAFDFKWHLQNIRSAMSSPDMRTTFVEDLCTSVLERCDVATTQLALRSKLQLCSTCAEPSEIIDVCAAVKAAGLSEPDAWELPDGSRLCAMATRRLEQLQREKKLVEGNVEETEKQLVELKSSIDLPAMHAAVTRAENCNIRSDLVAPIKQRLEMLQTQLPLRRQLQACGISEEFDEVDKVISTVQKAGFGIPDTWLLPDGPKLFARAVNRRDQLQEVQAVKGRIDAAAAKYDAKQLQVAIGMANELGLPREKYPEAHTLFLQLQSWRYLQEKSDDLRKYCATDPLYSLIVANLADQLSELGLKVDSAGMEEVAKETLTEQRKRGISFADSKNPVERQAWQRTFEDLANFSRLRDALTWGTKGLASSFRQDGDSQLDLKRVMLEYTSEDIAESLTELSEDKERDALANFSDLQRCMGEKASSGQRSEEDKEAPILSIASKDPSLCDEVFVQIMKQLTNNPSTTSATNGWTLLEKLCREILPSEELCEFVRAFAEKAARSNDPSTTEDDDSSDGTRKRRQKSVVYQTEVRMGQGAHENDFWEAVQPKLATNVLKILGEKTNI